MNWHDRIAIPDRATLDRLCASYRVTRLWLFGSVLRDDFRPESDVDVLVEFEPEAPIGLIELSRFQGDLASIFGRAVDLVPLGGLKPVLRDRVLAARELLYAA